MRLPIFKQRLITALILVKGIFATDFSELGFPSGCLKLMDSFTWEEVKCHLDMWSNNVSVTDFRWYNLSFPS